jgi:hypothetical protein
MDIVGLSQSAVLRVMSRAQLRDVVVLCAISSALTLALFLFRLWLLPAEREIVSAIFQ